MTLLFDAWKEMFLFAAEMKTKLPSSVTIRGLKVFKCISLPLLILRVELGGKKKLCYTTCLNDYCIFLLSDKKTTF